LPAVTFKDTVNISHSQKVGYTSPDLGSGSFPGGVGAYSVCGSTMSAQAELFLG